LGTRKGESPVAGDDTNTLAGAALLVKKSALAGFQKASVAAGEPKPSNVVGGSS
jgi:hypothetical protein